MHSNLLLLDSVVKMPLMSLPVRTVGVKLGNGATVLISPGSRLTADHLKTVPAVSDIVAPNLFHGAGMKQAREVFPSARAWGVPGSGLPEVLTESRWPYQEELAAFALEGLPKVKEFAFLHRQSKTLILTDAAFNLQEAKGIGTWIILNIFGTYRRFAVSRFWLKLVQDRAALIQSLQKLFKEDFDNIIVSHGEAVMGGAREKFRAALEERGLTV